MKSISTKELQRLLSLYLDGALDAADKARFEEYLAGNPAAAAEMRLWKKQQELLKSKTGVTSNEWFWPQLSARLGRQKTTPDAVYPFSRKYLPFAAALTVLIAAFGGVIVFQQRALLTKFFSDKKEQVQHIYQGNILQGKLMPLFTNLDKDQVLQFALFGTLPIDAQAKTALRVDESKENGTRIEFAKSEAGHRPPVTVAQFCKDIDATPAQLKSVDSILSTAKDKIQESVFLGENKSLAVHADLATFNRTMMSNIAASLELPQRRKFKRYLAVAGSPYTFVIPPAPRAMPALAPMPSPASAPRMPRPSGMEQFVVITPDSCSIARVNINVQQFLRNEPMTTQEIRVMNERTRSLIRDFAEHTRGQRRSNPSMRVFSGSNYFSIKVEDNVLEPQPNAMPFEVIARAPKAVQFQYEMHQMPGVPKIFDEDAAPPDQPDQSTPPVPGEWKQNPAQGRRIDLDSVITAPRDRKVRPQSNQTKKKYENPFEL